MIDSSVGLWGPNPPGAADCAVIPLWPGLNVDPARPLVAVSVRMNGVAASILENGAIELKESFLASRAAVSEASVICLKLSADSGPDTDGWRIDAAIDLFLPDGCSVVCADSGPSPMVALIDGVLRLFEALLGDLWDFEEIEGLRLKLLVFVDVAG